MSYVLAQALRSFQLGKEIKTKNSEPFPLSVAEFQQLKAKKLVAESGDANPKPPAGAPSSASPAAPASPPATAKKQKLGAKSKAKAVAPSV